MQENEFEKQVKKMMESFKLSPSNSVWEKVDRRINGDKQKKRPFILLLFMSLLIAGYFMYHASQKQAQSANNNTANKNINTPKADNNSSSIDSGTLVIKKAEEENRSNVLTMNKGNDQDDQVRLRKERLKIKTKNG